MVAVGAGTGDVLHARLRGGTANSGRGAGSFLAETIERARAAGASGTLTVRADSGFYNHAVVAAARKRHVRFSITVRLSPGLHQVIEAIPERDWTAIPYWLEGGADVAETTYTPFASQQDASPVRLIVRRVRPTPGSQLALLATYDYHAFITDREGDTLSLEADHRRHAEIENAIRDLKYGVGLNHLPSGKFGANGAWLAVQVLTHNLARWTARLGLGAGILTTKTLRRRLFSLPGRLARSAWRLTLHLPARWPWAEDCTTALQR
ncbi:MAG: IS1380 family transposase, partial [Chloroflexi bacterium]|nr:IS1380 family transposase [Chloroflexota bacterium]